MSAGKTFTIRGALAQGWDAFKKNAAFIYGYGFLSIVILALPNILFSDAGSKQAEQSLSFHLANLIFQIISIILTIGWIRANLKMVRGAKPTLDDFKPTVGVLVNSFIVSLLYPLIFIGGLLLLIIPGIIWGIMYSYANFLVIDKNLGAIEAFKASAAATRGNRWNLYKAGIVFAGVFLLGALALGIGLLIAIPVIQLAGLAIYDKLTS